MIDPAAVTLKLTLAVTSASRVASAPALKDKPFCPEDGHDSDLLNSVTLLLKLIGLKLSLKV